MSNVIKLETHSFRIKPKSYLPKHEECRHINTTLDENGQTVRCDDCGSNLDPYWVLREILDQIQRVNYKIKEERSSLEEDKEAVIHLKAAKIVEKAWRSKSMVPACPHCNRGILPTDNLGWSKVNKEIELRMRKTEGKSV